MVKKQLPFSFYFKYAWSAGKKNRLRKWIVVLACAASVAFAAVGMGNFGYWIGQMHMFMKNVSERELVVFNYVHAENQFDYMNLPIPLEKAERIADIPGVEQIQPLHMFYSGGVPYCILFEGGAATEGYEYEFETTRVTCTNAAGLKKESEFDITTMPGEEGSYKILSYPDENKMERMTLYLDESVTEGVYITERFMTRLGLVPEDLNGLSIEFDAWVLTAQRDDIMLVTDYYEDGTTEESEIPASAPFSQKVKLTADVKGIVPRTNYDDASGVCIYMSSAEMQNVLDDCPRDYKLMKLITERLQEINPDMMVEDFSERLPNAYYVTADSAEYIKEIKAEIESLDPNFTVLHEYQDIASGIKMITETRNVIIYVSFAILMVVLLLMALIYASLIDQRKFEFALLRANGFTKREVRRTVYMEMLLQLIKIFVFGIGFAFLIYYIGRRWQGFQFDEMTVLFLFVISFGAIILPTVISLLFVNKFEPDQVMRN